MARKLLFATNNAHKVAEVAAVLGDGFTLTTPRDCGICGDIPETQATLEGNALQKARYLYERTGVDCFADDTGLEVAALGGAPGVRSARYASDEHDFAANNRLLLRNMEGIADRRARFRTVIALILDGREYLFEGIVEGRIIDRACGCEGFGYDPLFVPEGYDRTFAEMEAGAKNAISHRGRAVRHLADFLHGVLREVRWGVIGCGAVCERKSVPAMYLTPGSRVVAAMRRDEARLHDFASRHPVGRCYTDAAQLLADPEVDIVYIATPHSTHKELTLAALAAGKDVYVEKPMGMDAAECAAMNEAAARCGRRIFVACYRRALPYFCKVKELLDSGVIGRPLTVEMRFLRPASASDRNPGALPWRLQREVGGEGYFYDLAPHMLDLLDFLLGEVADARGFKANVGGLYEVADTVTASLRFASGVQGTALWCFAAPAEARCDRVVIAGERGVIRYSSFSFEPIECETAAGTERFDIAPPDHIQAPLVATIVGELRGEGCCPSTGVSAARTAQVMDWIIHE